MPKAIWLITIVMLFYLSSSGQGTSINLAKEIFAPSSLFFRNGDVLDCEIKVFDRSKLHTTNKYHYRIDEKEFTVDISDLDSIKLGRDIYKKFKYVKVSANPKEKGQKTTVLKVGKQIASGKIDLYATYFLSDYGYTFVTDKADYLLETFFVNRDNSFDIINIPMTEVNEKAYVIKQLKKYTDECEVSEIFEGRKIGYQDIPILVRQINSKCL